MFLASQATSRLWSMHCEVKAALSKITIVHGSLTQHVSRPTTTKALTSFFPVELATRKLQRKEIEGVYPTEFTPDSFFGSRKISVVDVVDLFDYMMDNFTAIQNGTPVDALQTNIQSIQILSISLLASTKARPSGGQQKSNQLASIRLFCMDAILEATITLQYRKSILKGSAGKIRQGMVDIFSRYLKEDAVLDGF